MGEMRIARHVDGRSCLLALVLVGVRPGADQPASAARRQRDHRRPRPIPTPAGPTPTPSFVRPTPTPQPTFFVYTVVAGDNLRRSRKRFRTIGPEHRLLEPGDLPVARPGFAARTGRTTSQVGWMLRLIPNTEVDPGEPADPTGPRRPQAEPRSGG